MPLLTDGARGIVYVVDSATVARQIRDVAEYLFNILTSPRIHAIRYCFRVGSVRMWWLRGAM
jgi:hypothetical protein